MVVAIFASVCAECRLSSTLKLSRDFLAACCLADAICSGGFMVFCVRST